MALVLLGDVVGSRRIPDRRSFRKHVEQAFGELSRTREEALEVPIQLILGIDTFGAVVREAAAVPDLALDLWLALRPERARLIFARGPLDVGRGSTDFGRLDGPVLHAAKAAIVELEGRGDLLGFVGFGAGLDPALDAAGMLLGLACTAWTERQAEVVRHYRALGEQKAVARRLGVSPQAVSDSLKKSRYETVARSIAALADSLGGQTGPAAKR
jgi:hypothetical protein